MSAGLHGRVEAQRVYGLPQALGEGIRYLLGQFGFQDVGFLNQSAVLVVSDQIDLK